MPLLPFTLVFILGIVLQGSGVSDWFIIIPLLGACVFLIMRRNYPALMCCGLISGFVIAIAHEPFPFPPGLIDKETSFTATAMEVRSYEPTQVVIARIDSCNRVASGKMLVRLIIPSSVPEIEETDRLSFTASLLPLDRMTDLPDETDYDLRLRRMGVVASGFVSPDSIRIAGLEPGLFAKIRRFSHHVTLAIVRLPLSSSTREFLNATLTGDRSMLTPDTTELFAVTGLSHLLALSGLHIAILAGFAAILLFPMCMGGMRWMRTILIIILVWVFAVMTGLTPSVVRAGIMMTVLLAGSMMERVHSPFNSLCVAAIVILVFTPYAVFTIGFQLSFLAVGSILLFAEKFIPFSRRQSLPYAVATYPAVTLAALAGTVMVSAYYFNMFPLLSLPANFIGAMLMPLILIGGVVTLLFSVAGVPSALPAWITDKAYGMLEISAGWLESWHGAVIKDVYVSPLSVFIWFAVAGAFALLLYKKRKVYGIATVICVAFLLMVPRLTEAETCGTEVYIPRTHNHTSLLTRSGKRMVAVTTMPLTRHDELREEYERKYRRYLLKRGIDSVEIRDASRYILAIHEVCGKNFVIVSDSRQALLSSDLTSKCQEIDYLLICSGFRGDVVSLAKNISADSVLLSADLNLRLHTRYLRELSERGFAVRSLRSRGFVLRSEK